MPSLMPPHWRQSWGNILRFGTNVHYCFMNSLEFSFQRSDVKVTVTLQDIQLKALCNKYNNTSLECQTGWVKLWLFTSKRGQRLNTLWHHNVLLKNFFTLFNAIIQEQPLRGWVNSSLKFHRGNIRPFLDQCFEYSSLFVSDTVPSLFEVMFHIFF